MKKFRLFLMSLAFLGAGVGVFATALNHVNAFEPFRVEVNAPCDTIVQNEDCDGGSEICVVTSGPNANKQIHLLNEQTMDCEPLFKP